MASKRQEKTIREEVREESASEKSYDLSQYSNDEEEGGERELDDEDNENENILL
jgi:hypothetical protein